MGDRSPERGWARTAFSVTGLAPLGAFLVIHVLGWALAARHPALLDVGWSRAAFGAANLLLVWLPFTFHAGYGLAAWLGFAPLPEARSRPRSATRATGLLALAFVAFHTFELALPLWTGALSVLDLHGALCDALASTSAGGVPWRAALYVAGTAATVAHLWTGIYSVCLRQPRLRARLSEPKLRLICALLGFGVFAVAAHALLYFATGHAGL